MAKRPPKTIANDVLGTLRFTGDVGECLEYSVECNLAGDAVELVLYSEPRSADIAATIEVASKLVREFRKVKTRINRYGSDVLCKAISATASSSSAAIKPAALQKCLKLRFIDIHANGNASFSYNVGDLLAGHALVLYGTSDGSIQSHDTPE